MNEKYDFEDKLVEVCSKCHTASCWYGEFMCWDNKTAGTTLDNVAHLRQLGLEHPENWSDEKMTAVYGEPCPFGYR